MARKKKSGGEGVIIIIGGLLFLLATIPMRVWIGIAVVGGIWLVVRAFNKNQPITPEPKQVSILVTPPNTPPTNKASLEPKQALLQVFQLNAAPTTSTVQKNRTGEDLFVRVPAARPYSSGFTIPKSPIGYGEGLWYPSGMSVNVGDIHIPDGMVYVGTTLKTQFSENDPCLIDPAKSIASKGDYTERQMDYWPSYSQISPAARRAYLNWLCSGRKDPNADVGFVFLYFYGLERRALLDGSKDAAARAELPLLGIEIRRLLEIYGNSSTSFQNYASALLEWIELSNHPEALYTEPIPEFRRTWEIPSYLKLALGQAALAGVGVPAHIALAWVRLDPNSRLSTPANRCPTLFAKLFEIKYYEAYSAGLKLPKNKTKLKIVYRPASSAFRGFGEIKLSFGETPDVSVLTGPIGQLQKISEAAVKALEPYSRYLGRSKNTNSVNSLLEGLLLLPFELWPQSYQTVLLDIKKRIGIVGILTTQSFQDLLTSLGGSSSLARDKVQGLARVMEDVGIAMEPDVLGGAPTPKAEDKVILFQNKVGEVNHREIPAYQIALLTLQLASAVASSDGEFGDAETRHLQSQIEAWTHLTPGHQQRLSAHLKLLVATPPSLTSLKKSLDLLPTASQEAIASYMATVALADGMVSPAEVKMLEKVYKVLGVDTKKVFSDIHSAASGSAQTAISSKQPDGEFRLDQARIAALQKDTEKVSKLLSGIFVEEEQLTPVIAPTPAVEDAAIETNSAVGFLGLDVAHSSFARMLLSRPQWTRQELLDVAEDLDLMLDGALERINEASFDAHDLPLTEGDDIIEVSAEILEKLEA
jgi:uncharacterized tellurite resistance protein B-like protein